MTLFDKVFAYMSENKKTKADLADTLGIKTISTLNAKLTGDSELSFREAHALSNLIGIDMYELYKLAHGKSIS